MDVIVTAPEFKHSNKLGELKSKYTVKTISSFNNRVVAKAGPKAEITCDVEICSSGCIADWIWDGFGCICVSKCSVTIGWS